MLYSMSRVSAFPAFLNNKFVLLWIGVKIFWIRLSWNLSFEFDVDKFQQATALNLLSLFSGWKMNQHENYKDEYLKDQLRFLLTDQQFLSLSKSGFDRTICTSRGKQLAPTCNTWHIYLLCPIILELDVCPHTSSK